MAAMTTVYENFTSDGDSMVYTLPSHAVGDKRLMLQRRKQANSAQAIAEDEVSILHSAFDSDSILLAAKCMFSAKLRRPANCTAAIVAAALVEFRDMVNSDEFTAVTTGQKPFENG